MARVPVKVRAAAIADLMGGEQPAIVAERYGIDSATVRVWKQRYVTTQAPIVTGNVTDVAPIRQPIIERQQQEIGTLVLDLLSAKLKASAAIAKAASDPDWLVKQSGSELATLGEWLDSTAFAIGDRLAGGSRPASDTE